MRKIYLVLLFCAFSIGTYAQNDKSTSQDAVDFIFKIAKDFKSIDSTGSSSIILRIGISDGKLFIFTSEKLNSHYNPLNATRYKQFVINLSKVRVEKQDIFADEKQDITMYSLMLMEGDDLSKNFYKLNNITDQSKYYLKHYSNQLIKEEIGVFHIFNYFQLNDSRFVMNTYDKRILKAFDYIINSYGGGKVVYDDKSKF